MKKKCITGLLLLAFAVPSWAETYVCDEQLRGGANLQEANLVQYVREGSGFKRGGWPPDPIVYEDEFIIHILHVATNDGIFGTDVHTTIYKLTPANEHLKSEYGVISAYVRTSYSLPRSSNTWEGKCSIVD